MTRGEIFPTADSELVTYEVLRIPVPLLTAGIQSIRSLLLCYCVPGTFGISFCLRTSHFSCDAYCRRFTRSIAGIPYEGIPVLLSTGYLVSRTWYSVTTEGLPGTSWYKRITPNFVSHEWRLQ